MDYIEKYAQQSSQTEKLSFSDSCICSAVPDVRISLRIYKSSSETEGQYIDDMPIHAGEWVALFHVIDMRDTSDFEIGNAILGGYSECSFSSEYKFRLGTFNDIYSFLNTKEYVSDCIKKINRLIQSDDPFED